MKRSGRQRRSQRQESTSHLLIELPPTNWSQQPGPQRLSEMAVDLSMNRDITPDVRGIATPNVFFYRIFSASDNCGMANKGSFGSGMGRAAEPNRVKRSDLLLSNGSGPLTKTSMMRTARLYVARGFVAFSRTALCSRIVLG